MYTLNLEGKPVFSCNFIQIAIPICDSWNLEGINVFSYDFHQMIIRIYDLLDPELYHDLCETILSALYFMKKY